MEKIESKRFITSRGIVITGWVILVLFSVAILGAALYMLVVGRPLPDILENWASTVIGFQFGIFVSMVIDFMNGDKDKE